ncbi:MAG: helix-turn-helix transcriptional regulator [Verrucomicrobiota bacterium]
MSTASRSAKIEITLGNRVRTWRVHFNLTQGELEAKAGLAHNAVSRIEKEEVSPRLETVEKLAAAMAISIEQLQFGTPSRALTEEFDDDADAALNRLIKRLKRLPKKDALRAAGTIEAILDLME